MEEAFWAYLGTAAADNNKFHEKKIMRDSLKICSTPARIMT
jgi:hypothetical protein